MKNNDINISNNNNNNINNNNNNNNNSNNNNNNGKHFILQVILSNSPNYMTIIHSLGGVCKVLNKYIQNNPLQLK